MKLNLSKDLTGPKNAALAQIDADANRALESTRTSGEVAALVYKLKRDELSASDAGRPIAELSMLNAEALMTGKTPEELLDTWRRKIAEENDILIGIEATRQALKARVRSAKTPAEIDAALASISWA